MASTGETYRSAAATSIPLISASILPRRQINLLLSWPRRGEGGVVESGSFFVLGHKGQHLNRILFQLNRERTTRRPQSCRVVQGREQWATHGQESSFRTNRSRPSGEHEGGEIGEGERKKRKEAERKKEKERERQRGESAAPDRKWIAR